MELLVVIAIIGVLVALLLPAVQAPRAAAPRAQGKNPLKQPPSALLEPEGGRGHLPSAGYLGDVAGDPDLGFGERQPGGWVFNILPYIEQAQLHAMGKGITNNTEKRRQFAIRDGRAIEFLNCPSRRPARPYPNAANHTPLNSRWSELHGRTDYAQNAGDIKELERWCEDKVAKNFNEAAQSAWRASLERHSGVGYCGALVQLRHITDGLSNTYAIGERFLEPMFYETGQAHADDWPMYTGYQDDLYRTVYYDAGDPNSEPKVPLPDYNGVEGLGDRFGSAHPAGCHMAMVDGSVSTVSYDVDPEIHRRNGHRSDGGGPRTPDLPDVPP